MDVFLLRRKNPAAARPATMMTSKVQTDISFLHGKNEAQHQAGDGDVQPAVILLEKPNRQTGDAYLLQHVGNPFEPVLDLHFWNLAFKITIIWVVVELFPVPFPSPVTRGRCEVRKRPGFTGCSQLASTRAALSSPPPAAFRPAVSHTAILAGAPSPGPTSFPLPCRRVLSRSQRLAACRARYLWGTSTGEGLWYSGPWPVFPAFPGVREVILFTYVNLVKKKMFTIVNEKNIKKPPFDGR